MQRPSNGSATFAGNKPPGKKNPAEAGVLDTEKYDRTLLRE
jgi:hypothetical protein